MMRTIIYILFCLVTINAFCATATTPIFGTYNIECPAESDTYIGIPLTRMPEFSGTVQSVLSGDSKIVANGEPNWTTNKFVFSEESQTNRYYLKFTSGELEGAWYDIKANDAYSLQIAIGSAELAKVAIGDSFQIIPHWTLSTLFPDGGGFSKATGFSPTQGATSLYKYTKYTGDGLEYAIGLDRDSIVRYNYRMRGNVDNWIDADRYDASLAVFEPNSAFIAVQNSVISTSVVVNGIVPMCSTSFEVFTMSNGVEVPSQDIYMVVPSSNDMKLGELTDCLVNSGAFTSTTSVFRPGDTLYIYSNKKIGLNKSSDETCRYMAQSGKTPEWQDANRVSANSLVLKAGSVLLIRKNTSGHEFVTRCKFTPSYLTK